MKLVLENGISVMFTPCASIYLFLSSRIADQALPDTAAGYKQAVPRAGLSVSALLIPHLSLCIASCRYIQRRPLLQQVPFVQ